MKKNNYIPQTNPAAYMHAQILREGGPHAINEFMDETTLFREVRWLIEEADSRSMTVMEFSNLENESREMMWQLATHN